MTLREATAAVTSSKERSPKTILGFFAVGLGILASTSVLVVTILARTPALHPLIVPVLLFMAAVIVAALGAVILTAWKDPTILMLGEVSGEVYLANRRLTLGDSAAGEFPKVRPAAPRPNDRPTLPKTSPSPSEIQP